MRRRGVGARAGQRGRAGRVGAGRVRVARAGRAVRLRLRALPAQHRAQLQLLPVREVERLQAGGRLPAGGRHPLPRGAVLSQQRPELGGLLFRGLGGTPIADGLQSPRYPFEAR